MKSYYSVFFFKKRIIPFKRLSNNPYLTNDSLALIGKPLFRINNNLFTDYRLTFESLFF